MYITATFKLENTQACIGVHPSMYYFTHVTYAECFGTQAITEAVWGINQEDAAQGFLFVRTHQLQCIALFWKCLYKVGEENEVKASFEMRKHSAMSFCLNEINVIHIWLKKKQGCCTDASLGRVSEASSTLTASMITLQPQPKKKAHRLSNATAAADWKRFWKDWRAWLQPWNLSVFRAAL